MTWEEIELQLVRAIGDMQERHETELKQANDVLRSIREMAPPQPKCLHSRLFSDIALMQYVCQDCDERLAMGYGDKLRP